MVDLESERFYIRDENPTQEYYVDWFALIDRESGDTIAVGQSMMMRRLRNQIILQEGFVDALEDIECDECYDTGYSLGFRENGSCNSCGPL